MYTNTSEIDRIALREQYQLGRKQCTETRGLTFLSFPAPTTHVNHPRIPLRPVLLLPVLPVLLLPVLLLPVLPVLLHAPM